MNTPNKSPARLTVSCKSPPYKISPQKVEELVFPVDQLPKCWHDKSRINALFAPFRLKSVNPHDWESKLKFWRGIIRQWCEIKGCSSFNLLELKSVFKESGRSPACLEMVIQEMFSEGEIQTEATYLEPPQNTWSSWAVNTFLKRPARWSFEKMKQSIIAPTVDINTKYVITDLAKSHGDKLLNLISDQYGNNYQSELLCINEVLENTENVDLCTDGVKLGLHSLHSENRISLAELPASSILNSDATVTVVKIGASNNECSSITEADVGIYSLQQNEKTLMVSINTLEEKKELLRLQAKKYLEQKKILMAKNCLKKKKILDNAIAKRTSTLDNIQGLLSRIQESQSDGKILDSYQSGLAALKNTMKDLDLTPDRVQDTMDDIQQTMEDQDEVQNVLGRTIITDSEADLEDELADLLQEEPEELVNTKAKANKKEETLSHKDKPHPEVMNKTVLKQLSRALCWQLTSRSQCG